MLIKLLLPQLALGCLLLCNIVAKELEVPGAVLKPGQSIESTNKFGTVKISYVAPLKRKFEWDGQSRVVKILHPIERRRSPDPTVTGNPDFVGGLYNSTDACFF